MLLSNNWQMAQLKARAIQTYNLVQAIFVSHLCTLEPWLEQKKIGVLVDCLTSHLQGINIARCKLHRSQQKVEAKKKKSTHASQLSWVRGFFLLHCCVGGAYYMIKGGSTLPPLPPPLMPHPFWESYRHTQITSEAVQSHKVIALSANMLGTRVAIATEPSYVHACMKKELIWAELQRGHSI